MQPVTLDTLNGVDSDMKCAQCSFCRFWVYSRVDSVFSLSLFSAFQLLSVRNVCMLQHACRSFDLMFDCRRALRSPGHFATLKTRVYYEHDAGKTLSIAMGPIDCSTGAGLLAFVNEAAGRMMNMDASFCLWIRDTAWNSTAHCDL